MIAVTLLLFLLGAAGVGGAHYRMISPILGFAILGFVIFLLILTGLPGLLGMLRDRANFAAMFRGVLALVCLGGIGFVVFNAHKNPLNDITTDGTNPPKFIYPLPKVEVKRGKEFLPSDNSTPRDYQADFSVQTQTYGDMPRIKLTMPTSIAMKLIVATVKNKFPEWKIVLEDFHLFHVEAEVESKLFHFVDDVVIEARPDQTIPENSIIEMRSRSRVGQSDFGVNAKRILELNQAILAEAPPFREEAQKAAAAKVAAPAVPAPAPIPAVTKEKKK